MIFPYYLYKFHYLENSMKSLHKVLDIIDAVAEHGPMGIREISQRTGFPPATTHRMVSALVKRRYLVQNSATRAYALALRFLELGSIVQSRFNLTSIARPHLEHLVEATHESGSIIVRDGDEAVYLDHVRDAHMLQLFTRLGARVPLYSTGGGKAMLSRMTDPEIAGYLERVSLQRITTKTITDRKAFLKSLKTIRERGYAIDDEEMEVGVRCVAAPVFNHRQQAVAAISVTGAAVRIVPEQIDYYGQIVKNSAAVLSRNLGYSA